jgi:uncharacterized protein YecE (DUF72 family)
LQLHVGCSGWSYSAWQSHFYPKHLESKNYLEYYSKVFDYVEIDSSFYQIPSAIMARRWATVTPDNFKFTAKMVQTVTHEKRLGEGIDSSLRYFYEAMTPLQEKLLAILIQVTALADHERRLEKTKENAVRSTI